MKQLLLIPILAAVVLLLVSCGASTPATTGSTPTAPSPSTASTSTSGRPVCDGLAKIDNALTSLSKAGDNITVGEVKRVQAQVSLLLNVVGKLVPSDSNASAILNQLKTANDQIGQDVAGLPDGDTLAQHGPRLQSFRQHVAQAQSAALQVATRLNCAG